ncbi:MAG: aspartate aminotransferase family protein [Candidatus Omnitrophota bacterium]
MNTVEIKDMYNEYVLSTYMRGDICLVKGEGARVEDSEGNTYLDFFPGWAVSGIGHRHPRVVERLRRQLDRILHVSNNFYNDVQPLLAQKIIEHSFPGKVFFANSGAEANEGAIKFARKYGDGKRYEIITMEKSFHGRTLATLTATGQEKVKKGFHPLPEGFKHVPFNDIGALRAAVTANTVAIMLEPVQGEGGINVPGKEYIKALAAICAEKDILLIMDEVQTCMGRTGEMFAYKHFGLEPDAMTLAKSLGGGLPIGALVIKEEHKDVLGPGSHASTFGGSPIVSAAALGVFEAIEEDGLLDNTAKMGKYLVEKIKELSEKFPIIEDIRGLGLMIGVKMGMEDASCIPELLLKKGLLINCTQGNILRIMPPITVTAEEIDEAIKKIAEVLEEI